MQTQNVSRFGEPRRSRYKTNSFMCVPLIASGDVKRGKGFKQLRDCACSRFDPEIVEAFIRAVSRIPEEDAQESLSFQ